MVIVDNAVVNYIGNISVKYATGRKIGNNGGRGKKTSRQNPLPKIGIRFRSRVFPLPPKGDILLYQRPAIGVSPAFPDSSAVERAAVNR